MPQPLASIFQLLLLTGALWLFIGILLIPLGHLVAEKAATFLPTRLRLLLSFGFSALLYGGLAAACSLLNLSPRFAQSLLIAVVTLSLFLWLKRELWREICSRDVAFGFLVHFLLVILCSLIVAFPVGDYRDVMADTIMYLTGLPVDLLIPYNFSRYVVEHISTNAYEIVPHWGATDRGPLAALLNAAMFQILGLRESQHWLVTTPGFFFVYQVLMTYLNALALIGVWILSLEYFGKRAALYALLLLCASYFFLLNIIFSWPKFFMSYLFLCAMTVWNGENDAVSGNNWQRIGLCGSFFGAAQLAHDSALFCFAAWVGYVLLTNLFTNSEESQRHGTKMDHLRRKCFPAGVMVSAFLFINAPWIAYKTLVTPPSPRLLHMHVLCDLSESAGTVPFGQALRQYLKDHTWSELALTRVRNLYYPFKVSAACDLLGTASQSVLLFLNQLSIPLFFQIYIGVGLSAFFGALIGLLLMRKNRDLRRMLPFLIAGYGALPVFAVLSGCENNTVNHQWAYPAMAATFILGGVVFSRLPSLFAPLYALSLFLGVGALVMALYFQGLVAPFLHGSPLLIEAQLLVALLLLMAIFFELFSLDLKRPQNS